jgi:hypothetical protein
MGRIVSRIADAYGELGHGTSSPVANRRRVELPLGNWRCIAIGGLSEHDLAYVEGAGFPGIVDKLPPTPREIDYLGLPRVSVGAPLILNGASTRPVIVAARSDLALMTIGDNSRVLGRLHVVAYECLSDALAHPLRRPTWETHQSFVGGGSLWVPFAGRRELVIRAAYDSATDDTVTLDIVGHNHVFKHSTVGVSVLAPGTRDAVLESDIAGGRTTVIAEDVAITNSDISGSANYDATTILVEDERYEMIQLTFSDDDNRDLFVHVEARD